MQTHYQSCSDRQAGTGTPHLPTLCSASGESGDRLARIHLITSSSSFVYDKIKTEKALTDVDYSHKGVCHWGTGLVFLSRFVVNDLGVHVCVHARNKGKLEPR